MNLKLKMALFIMLTTFSFLSAQEKPEVEIGGH